MTGHILQSYHDQLPDGLVLLPSSGGVFEVTLGGEVLFSKKESGRFPERDEIDAALNKHFAAAK